MQSGFVQLAHLSHSLCLLRPTTISFCSFAPILKRRSFMIIMDSWLHQWVLVVGLFRVPAPLIAKLGNPSRRDVVEMSTGTRCRLVCRGLWRENFISPAKAMSLEVLYAILMRRINCCCYVITQLWCGRRFPSTPTLLQDEITTTSIKRFLPRATTSRAGSSRGATRRKDVFSGQSSVERR